MEKKLAFALLFGACSLTGGSAPLYSQRTVDVSVANGFVRMTDRILKVVTIGNPTPDGITATLRCDDDLFELVIKAGRERSVLVPATRETEFAPACELVGWRRNVGE